jgi:nucleoside-diphosphate-sugar epimerase
VRVVVTGSSGQLGGTVISQLRAAGVDAVGVDTRPGPRTDAVADVRDATAMRAALARATAVVHTASLHGPHVPARSKSDFIDVNVAGTQTLLDAALAAGVRRFVFSSTTSVYGHALEPDGDAAVWVDVALVPLPRDVYDVTKLAAERLCELFTAETGIPTACLRVSRFSFDTVPELAVPYCLHRAVNVGDAARAHVLALERPARGHAVLNVSGASPFRREDAPDLLVDAASVLRRRAPRLAAAMVRHGHALPRRIERVYAIGRATVELGYRPRHGVMDLLATPSAAGAAPGASAAPAPARPRRRRSRGRPC